MRKKQLRKELDHYKWLLEHADYLYQEATQAHAAAERRNTTLQRELDSRVAANTAMQNQLHIQAGGFE